MMCVCVCVCDVCVCVVQETVDTGGVCRKRKREDITENSTPRAKKKFCRSE